MSLNATCDLQPLRTDRLTLRLFAESDLDDMYAYQGLPEVARYLYRPPRDRARCAEVIERIGQGTSWKEDGDSLTLAVCRRDAPEVIGEVMVSLSAAHAGQAEIGWVFHPGHGGRGLCHRGRTRSARSGLSTAVRTPPVRQPRCGEHGLRTHL